MSKSKLKLILTFATTHQVIGAERRLLAVGVAVEVVPKPQTIRGECGVVLSVPWEERSQAMNALLSLEAEITNIYQDDCGRILELDRGAMFSSSGSDGR
jgi:hypothetical protein